MYKYADILKMRNINTKQRKQIAKLRYEKKLLEFRLESLQKEILRLQNLLGLRRKRR